MLSCQHFSFKIGKCQQMSGYVMSSEAQTTGSFLQKLYCEHSRAADVVMVLDEELEE